MNRDVVLTTVDTSARLKRRLQRKRTNEELRAPRCAKQRDRSPHGAARQDRGSPHDLREIGPHPVEIALAREPVGTAVPVKRWQGKAVKGHVRRMQFMVLAKVHVSKLGRELAPSAPAV